MVEILFEKHKNQHDICTNISQFFLKNYVLLEVFVSVPHRFLLKCLNGRLSTFDVQIVIPT